MKNVFFQNTYGIMFGSLLNFYFYILPSSMPAHIGLSFFKSFSAFIFENMISSCTWHKNLESMKEYTVEIHFPILFPNYALNTSRRHLYVPLSLWFLSIPSYEWITNCLCIFLSNTQVVFRNLFFSVKTRLQWKILYTELCDVNIGSSLQG